MPNYAPHIKTTNVIQLSQFFGSNNYKTISLPKYAVFTARGPFASAIGKAWTDIWQNKSLERTFTSDFEWYDSKSTNDDMSVVKIFIAIK